MPEEENKSASSETSNMKDALREVEKLKKQLEEERKSAENKEKALASSLQESKRMSSYLKQITNALTKERKKAIEKSQKEKLLWKLIDRINSSFDLEQILQSTVDELGYYFKADRCGIIIPNYKQNNKDLVREFSASGWKRSKEVYSQVSLSVLYRTVTKFLKPLIINDTMTHELTSGHISEELRSILLVPLLQYNTELVGVIYLHQCDKQRTWTEPELQLLQSATNPIATAVEKSRLFSRAKAWGAREKLLNRLTSRIRGSLNIKVILERTVAELGQALQTSRCFINIIDHKTSREIIAHEFIATNVEPIGAPKENPLIINKLSEKETDFISITDIYKESRLVKLNKQEIQKLHKTNARAILAVPMTFQTKLFGWICFHQCNVPRIWTSEEINFIQSAASQVGVAINQAEMVEELSEYKTRISRELKQAAQLQTILLRGGADTNKNLSIAVSYHPHHSVSGDFYWVHELAPHKIGILIGDVSGKGPAAALLTGYIIGEMKGLLEKEDVAWKPDVFLTELSSSIYEQNQYSDYYATAWYGIFNVVENTVVCCNAGHPSPCLVKNNSSLRLDDNPGVPLGLLSVQDDVGKYTTKEFNLNPNDRMIIFTDGLTEQKKLDGTFLGDAWITKTLENCSKNKLNEIPEEMIRNLNILSEAASADDDRLLVAVEMPEVKKTEFYETNQEHIQERIEVILKDAKEKGLPESFVPSLKLGLIEAIYNSLRHGLSKIQKDKKEIVKFSWWVKEGSFSCVVIDPGPGFNWKEAKKEKKKIESVDITSEGGRGIPLIFEIFNEVIWNPQGNEIGLTLRW